MAEAPPNLESQVRLSKLLGLGFVLSLITTGGLSSLAALIIGVRALRIIKRSRGEVVGKRMAWWCVVVGALGSATVLPYIILLFVRAVRQ